MPPQKGKAPTKGAKQIIEENAATVKFYRNMSFFAVAVNVVFFLFTDTVSMVSIICNIFSIFLYIVCHKIMKHMSKAAYNDTNQIMDSGLDLNMDGGVGEYLKDVVILTSLTHSLSTISDYFWLLFLLLPLGGFAIFWVNVLGPWFFQPGPDNTEQDDKKRKKMERKMKRLQK